MNTEEHIIEPTEGAAGKKTESLSPEENISKTPSHSRRPSFDGIRRQLTDTELANPAVQKLLLDMLEETEASRDEFKSYVEAFHEADKRAAILGEKLNTDRSIEVFFGVGIGLGGTIFGLAPFFWSKGILYGVICLIIGILLILGVSIGRIVKK